MTIMPACVILAMLARCNDGEGGKTPENPFLGVAGMDFGSLAFLAPVSALVALGVAAYLSASISRKDEGTQQMRSISEAIREGASAYLKRQYRGVMLFFAVMFVLLLVLAGTGYLSYFTPFAFLSGGFFS